MWPRRTGCKAPRRRPNSPSFGARSGNRSDATPTIALLPQSETGKINCVHLPRYGRLPPGARVRKRNRLAAVPDQDFLSAVNLSRAGVQPVHDVTELLEAGCTNPVVVSAAHEFGCRRVALVNDVGAPAMRLGQRGPARGARSWSHSGPGARYGLRTNAAPRKYGRASSCCRRQSFGIIDPAEMWANR